MSDFQGSQEALDAGPGHATDDQATIVFVGSRLQFPDFLLRLLRSEIETSEVMRVSDIAALAGLHAHVIVLDETVADAVDAQRIDTLRADSRANVAIAYRDASRATRFVRGDRHSAQAVSLLPMDQNVESWLAIVRLILSGCSYLPARLFEAAHGSAGAGLLGGQAGDGAATGQGADETGPCNLHRLTARELEVLQLVAKGFQNKHIASRLNLSEHTVKLHLHHVISKLGARNRTDAAMRFRSGNRP